MRKKQFFFSFFIKTQKNNLKKLKKNIIVLDNLKIIYFIDNY
jgi:hypothetical protein